MIIENGDSLNVFISTIARAILQKHKFKNKYGEYKKTRQKLSIRHTAINFIKVCG